MSAAPETPVPQATEPAYVPVATLLEQDELRLTRIDVPAAYPELRIEVVSDPHVDVPPDDVREAELADAVVRRYVDLRRAFEAPAPHVLVVRGCRTLDGDVSGVDADAVWAAALERLSTHAEHLVPVAPDDPDGDAAALFEVRLDGDVLDEPLAIVAVVAVPRTSAEDMTAGVEAERLVQRLTREAARNVPLHVIVVTGDARPSGRFLTRCERLRASLVLARAEGRDGVVTVSRTLVRPGQGPAEIAIIPCPSFKRGEGRPGVTHVRLDLFKGAAAVAFRSDLGSDRPPRPVQVVRRLVSASRVTSSEQRLHRIVAKLLDEAPPSPELDALRAHVQAHWEESGYAALAMAKDRLPLTPTRHTRYNLLLLLRPRAGGYEILLSNHSPLRASPLSDWNTLLLPAFRNARELLEHLRDDVLRQATERAEDFERAERARGFENAVQRILETPGDHLWEDEIREVAQTKLRKISPTTGAVTEYEYRLVTLLPLVDRGIARAPDGDDETGEDAAARRDRHRIIDWLDGLESVRAPGELDGPGLPAEALAADGCGLRWDPVTALAEHVDATVRRRLTPAYPGAIWFPLVDHAGAPLWRACPSIVARNADVMTWVTELIDSKIKDDRPMPDQFQLGRFRGQSDRYVVDHFFPFDGVGREVDGVPGRSTVDALRRVPLSDEFDLADTRPYAGADIRRVWLRREPALGGEYPRDAIVVYAADAGDPPEPDLSERERLGYLRPVQRYVLTQGLERVARLDEDVREQLGEHGDRWGFVRVRKGGAPDPVSVTPPIIEQLHPADRDDCMPEEGMVDFIVCDGNHRVVHAVWKQRRALPAVAVLGDLPEPYYAHPYGRLEWSATAGTELPISPEPAFKYLRRWVDPAKHPPPPGKEEQDLYRRFFRRLEEGFGPMGGQGGRF